MTAPVFIAVALLSAAVIGYEILLTRLFSIIQYHHFAYMVISLALLGFGAAGTFVALARVWLEKHFTAAFCAGAAAFGVAALGCFLIAQRVPFNALEIAWGGWQLAWLPLLYLLLSAPFFFAATAICLAFAHLKDRPAQLYRYDLVGAGAGAPLVLALFFLGPPALAMKVLAVIGIVAAGIVALSVIRRTSARMLAGLALAAMLALPLAVPGAWTALRLSPYKSLSIALTAPDAAIVAERYGPLGWLALVESPTIPLRHAPGLSFLSKSAPPEQLALFTDGGSLSAIARFDGDLTKLAYLDAQTAALPYHMLSRPNVLVLGAGGGAEVLRALHEGAGPVVAGELNRQMADLVRHELGAFSGGLYDRQDVDLHVAEARTFVARSTARYDLIQLALVDSFSAAAAGVFALNESTLYTIEAFTAYLDHLAPGGLLAVTRWIKLPPRDALKLIATAADALTARGVADAGQRIALIRGWKTSTLIVKNGALQPADLAAIRSFAELRGFDLAWLPGMAEAEANRFNRLHAPLFFLGARALLEDGREGFIERYKFALAPATDDRPYFFHNFKWAALPELLALRAGGGLAHVEWGYVILIATLVQAVLASAVLILLPLWVGSTGARAGALMWGRWRLVLYFLALGLGFMFVEMAFNQRFVLFLGHPLYAIAVVLAAFLVFAGLGSGYAERLARHLDTRLPRLGGLPSIATAIALLAGVYIGVLPSLLNILLPLPEGARITLAVLLIAPLAFLMGMPFPLGLARLSREAPGMIPWAWSINGCASVVSVVLAAVLAIHIGFTAVVGCALAIYLIAAMLFAGGRRFEVPYRS